MFLKCTSLKYYKSCVCIHRERGVYVCIHLCMCPSSAGEPISINLGDGFLRGVEPSRRGGVGAVMVQMRGWRSQESLFSLPKASV